MAGKRIIFTVSLKDYEKLQEYLGRFDKTFLPLTPREKSRIIRDIFLFGFREHTKEKKKESSLFEKIKGYFTI